MDVVPGPPMRQRVLLADTTPTPLGQVTLAARIEDGRGIMPRLPFRIYGSYALIYITRGEGTYQDAGGRAHPVRAGDAIFVFPEVPHTYGPPAGRRWSELYLVFHGPVFDTCRAQGLLDPRRPLRRLLPPEAWAARFEEVAGGGGAPAASARGRQVCALLALLTDIASDAEGEIAAPGGSSWAADACHLLAQDLGTPLTAAELVTRAGRSYETFRRVFTATLGMSPVEYRAHRRMEVACHLLQYTRMTNAQIAESLAYSDEYYFSKRFKRLRGVSPREFRRQTSA